MADQPLNVVCVRWGDKYGDDWVIKLRNMCARHLPVHRFRCFTDKPIEGIECHVGELMPGLWGWWQKIGLFRPGLLHGNTLYLDLDVIITGSLQPFLNAFYSDPTRLWALDDFSYSLVKLKQGLGPEMRRTLGGDGTINSSVMLWRAGVNSERVFNEFDPECLKELHGDQNWITKCLWPRGGINLLPSGTALSYKYGKRQQAPIVVFHGEPKPDQVRDQWVIDHWR